MADRPRRVLLLKPCCLGDVLLATPLAAAIVQGWPDCQLDWAVDRHSLPALAGNPYVRSRLDASGCVRGDWHVGSLLRLVRAVRRERYDVAFVPERSPLLAAIPWLARVPMRVGLDSGGRGRLHTIRIPVLPVRHEAELYLDLARAAGLRPSEPRLVFRPSPTDQRTARRVLAALLTAPAHSPVAGAPVTLSPGPVIAAHLGGGVNPGMQLLEKRWPAERWAELLDGLHDDLGAQLVMLGGAADGEYAAAVKSLLRAPVLDLVGQLDLGEVAAVLQLVDLYIGHDTGVSHLTTAVGAPAVAIFGPTDPRRYGPLPGTGIAVAPARGAVDQLAQAKGSAAILSVLVADVRAACEAMLGVAAG